MERDRAEKKAGRYNALLALSREKFEFDRGRKREKFELEKARLKMEQEEACLKIQLEKQKLSDVLLMEQEKAQLARYTKDSRIMFQDVRIVYVD